PPAGRTTPPKRQHPPITLAERGAPTVAPVPGTWVDRGALMAGPAARWSELTEDLDTIAEASASLRRHGTLIMINTSDGLAPDRLDLTGLGTALLYNAIRQPGRRPVVVAWEPTPEVTALLGAYQSVAVIRGRNEPWRLTGADGAELRSAAAPTRDLYEAAAEAAEAAPAAVLAGLRLPPHLAQWLTQDGWDAAEEYLRRNVDELSEPHISDALTRLRELDPHNRVLAAYEVLLQLLHEPDGRASLGQQRWVPKPADQNGTDYTVDYPLLPFAIDALKSSHTEHRKPFVDQLLRQMYEGRLTGAQASALARGLLDADQLAPDEFHQQDRPGTVTDDSGWSDAKVFTALDQLLRPLTPGAATQRAYDAAVKLVLDCAASPYERIFSALRLRDLIPQIRTSGIPAREGRPRVAPLTAHGQARGYVNHADLIANLAGPLFRC
ncbi:MAG TPA: hypothetical protein VJT31_11985, partial [Rugosimonospora sp.]|nr:hypothetical protein [Rugosimonospora sp.]